MTTFVVFGGGTLSTLMYLTVPGAGRVKQIVAYLIGLVFTGASAVRLAPPMVRAMLALPTFERDVVFVAADLALCVLVMRSRA